MTCDKSLDWPEPPCALAPGAPLYPRSLLDLAEPPDPLRTLGKLPPLGGSAIAIVGTRHPSDAARSFAYDLAFEIAQAGQTIVSGGALGIDGAAHRAAIDAGGVTVAVLPAGFRRPYPPQHVGLFAEILRSGGAVVSEGQESWAPHPGLFLRRNRLIAALANATVVVQAPARSGALSTARAAMLLKRKLFCVPGSPWDVRAEGTLALLRRGGEICTSARDVLSVRPLPRRDSARLGPKLAQDPTNFSKLGEDAEKLFRYLHLEPAHPDRIARELDRPTERVQELLLTFELGGLVRRRTDGSYCLVRGGLADG